MTRYRRALTTRPASDRSWPLRCSRGSLDGVLLGGPQKLTLCHAQSEFGREVHSSMTRAIAILSTALLTWTSVCQQQTRSVVLLVSRKGSCSWVLGKVRRKSRTDFLYYLYTMPLRSLVFCALQRIKTNVSCNPSHQSFHHSCRECMISSKTPSYAIETAKMP